MKTPYAPLLFQCDPIRLALCFVEIFLFRSKKGAICRSKLKPQIGGLYMLHILW